jgi:ribonuclease D
MHGRPECRAMTGKEPRRRPITDRHPIALAFATPRALLPQRRSLPGATMTVRFHRGDLPDLSNYDASVAIDTETLGLNPHRDRLCVVQLSPGDGSADVVQIPKGWTQAPNLKRLLADEAVTKIFHFARFDIAALHNAFGVITTPVYCTKIASKLVRTYTDRHGLKDLVRDLIGIDLSKQQQSSDWGAETLTEAQLAYAASDVLHLHELMAKLDVLLAREGRTGLARACFEFLPTRALLDLGGWPEVDIFAHM